MSIETAGQQLGAGHRPVARLRRREWLAVLSAAARSRRGGIGLSVASIVLLVAVIGPFVAPFSPTEFVAAPSNSRRPTTGWGPTCWDATC